MAVVLVRVRSVDLAQRALSASRPSQRNCRASWALDDSPGVHRL